MKWTSMTIWVILPPKRWLEGCMVAPPSLDISPAAYPVSGNRRGLTVHLDHLLLPSNTKAASANMRLPMLILDDGTEDSE